MSYLERRMPVEWLALGASVAFLIFAAVMYMPASPAIAVGFSRVRVLYAACTGHVLDITLWAPSTTTISISGDVNNQSTTVGAGIATIPAVLSGPKRCGAVKLCISTGSVKECGTIYPIGTV